MTAIPSASEFDAIAIGRGVGAMTTASIATYLMQISAVFLNML